MAFNILIVDDSRITRDMIAKTIKMAGVPVGEMFRAENGVEALEVMEHNWVDLALVDLNMPVMDGVSLIERMSADEDLRAVPVVVVSTEGSQTKIERLRQKGVKAFVHKPFAPEEIRDVMRGILGDWDGPG